MIMRLPHGKPIEKHYETQFPNIQMLKDEIEIFFLILRNDKKKIEST